VTVGATHTCVLLDSGDVACWGNGLYGQLANGTTAVNRGDEPGELGDALPLVDLGTGRTATTLEARGLDVCALLDDGHVKCWGYNGYGQLGQGNTDNLGDDPAEVGDGLPVVDLGTGRTATAVFMGESHECARLDDGSVKCWGLGAWAQLGLGDREWRGDGPDEMGDALASLSFEPSTAVSTCAGQEVTVDLGQEQPPTAGADVILGTPGEDVIRGLGGDDVICGLGGTDTIGGGGGKDRIFGGGGDDSLRAGPGGGLLAGNAGADTLRGDKGNDTLRGGADDDVITGGAGNDVADGGAGDNTCDLAPGRDRALSCG
jgi:Ca2+-binding RTX toxin-like protein